MKGRIVEVELTESKPGATPLDGKMRVGDAVEFMTDMQTEKGPSAGTIIDVDNRNVVISHSDHPGEVFEKSKLKCKGCYRHKDGLSVLWIMA